LRARIKGYAFTANELETRDERRKRYEQLNKDSIRIQSTTPRFAHTVYTGELLDKDLTELDILLLCDRGNTCFGGVVERDGTRFVATVYTD
ncbi:MAG: hypothetical protein RDU41_08365, partial [Clostridia bacterium]|nr:hypothetical protein [Clostridia bacterium]